MKLVEDHTRHARECGIALQPPQEQPIGQHFKPGGCRTALLKPHPIAHRAAHRFIEAGGEPLCGGLGRQTPGLQHQNGVGFSLGQLLLQAAQ